MYQETKQKQNGISLNECQRTEQTLKSEITKPISDVATLNNLTDQVANFNCTNMM